MKISTKIVVDIETGEILSRESIDYHGPVALAISAGGGSNKQSNYRQSQQQSGVNYNEPFLNLIFGREGQFYGTKDGKEKYTPGVFGYEPEEKAQFVRPSYTSATYTGGKYTPGQFTAVAPEGFKRLEDVAYQSQASKLNEAYKQTVARQREELSQAGALNSPAQYLEGGTRAATDRSYLDSLQQAARDAFGQRLGLEEREAGRRTGFDVGEGAARTAYDVGQGAAQTAYDVSEATRQTGFGEREAARETTFNQKQIDDLWNRFMQKIGVALEASKYQIGTEFGTGEGSGGSGNLTIFQQQKKT